MPLDVVIAVWPAAADTPGEKTQPGSRACLIACMAAMSSGDRASGSQARLARPIPCSALMLPPCSTTSRSTTPVASSATASGRPSRLTCELPSARCPYVTTWAVGNLADRTARNSDSKTACRLGGTDTSIFTAGQPVDDAAAPTASV